MSLFNQLKSIVSKIKELEIPNYETRLSSYLNEDEFIDYLILLLNDETRWVLQGIDAYNRYINYTKKDGTTISLNLKGHKELMVSVEIKGNSKRVLVVEEEDDIVTDIIYNKYNKRKFKQLVKLYVSVESYLCELKEGKVRYKIKKLFN